MTDKLSPTVTDAMIEAGIAASDKLTDAMRAREQSDNPEDMPDYDEGDLMRAIYLAMHSLSASGDVVEQAAIYAWEEAPSRMVGCFRLWNEIPEPEKDDWRKIARAALTASGNSGAVSDDLRALISEASIERLAEDIAIACVDCRPEIREARHRAMVRLGERLRKPLERDLKFARALNEGERS
jgi:hypothetical protein